MSRKILLIGGSPIYEYRRNYYVPHNYARHLLGLAGLYEGIEFYAQVIDRDVAPGGTCLSDSRIRIIRNRLFSNTGRKSPRDFAEDQRRLYRIARNCIGFVESFPASGGLLAPIHLFPRHIKRILYLNTDIRKRIRHRAGLIGNRSLFGRSVDLYFSLSQDLLVRWADVVLVRGQSLFMQYEKCARYIELARPMGSFSSEYAFRRHDSCQDNKVHILFVGHLAQHKRVLDLVNAVAIANRMLSGLKMVFLTLVGEEHPDAQETISIAKIYYEAERLGIRQKIACLGRVDDAEMLSSLYRKADIFALVSAFEGFPRVIEEALINSLPVITTPVGGIPGQLRDGHEALFVPVGEPIKIAEAIERIIYSSSLRHTLINEGYNWVTSQSLETSWQQYYRLLS